MYPFLTNVSLAKKEIKDTFYVFVFVSLTKWRGLFSNRWIPTMRRIITAWSRSRWVRPPPCACTTAFGESDVRFTLVCLSFKTFPQWKPVCKSDITRSSQSSWRTWPKSSTTAATTTPTTRPSSSAPRCSKPSSYRSWKASRPAGRKCCCSCGTEVLKIGLFVLIKISFLYVETLPCLFASNFIRVFMSACLFIIFLFFTTSMSGVALSHRMWFSFYMCILSRSLPGKVFILSKVFCFFWHFVALKPQTSMYFIGIQWWAALTKKLKR